MTHDPHQRLSFVQGYARDLAHELKCVQPLVRDEVRVVSRARAFVETLDQHLVQVRVREGRGIVFTTRGVLKEEEHLDLSPVRSRRQVSARVRHRGLVSHRGIGGELEPGRGRTVMRVPVPTSALVVVDASENALEDVAEDVTGNSGDSVDTDFEACIDVKGAHGASERDAFFDVSGDVGVDVEGGIDGVDPEIFCRGVAKM